jgi:hypothetical protein
MKLKIAVLILAFPAIVNAGGIVQKDVDLPKGEKLVMYSTTGANGNELSLVTRPMRPNEKPETYTVREVGFSQTGPGIFDGSTGVRTPYFRQPIKIVEH